MLKNNVVCMSLSRFYSFQSRFVTYLLNRPRISSNLRATSPTQLLLFHFITQNYKVTYKLWYAV